MNKYYENRDMVDILLNGEQYSSDIVDAFSRWIYAFNPRWDSEYSGHTKMSFEAFKAGWVLGGLQIKEGNNE